MDVKIVVGTMNGGREMLCDGRVQYATWKKKRVNTCHVVQFNFGLRRLVRCRNPHACAIEAQTRLERIIPKLNPLSPGDEHGDLSLTNRRKKRNIDARTKNDEILFERI